MTPWHIPKSTADPSCADRRRRYAAARNCSVIQSALHQRQTRSVAVFHDHELGLGQHGAMRLSRSLVMKIAQVDACVKPTTARRSLARASFWVVLSLRDARMKP